MLQFLAKTCTGLGRQDPDRVHGARAAGVPGAWHARDAIGRMLGMLVAHHKVNTCYFKYGLPIMLVINVAVVAFLMQAGAV